jgi:hypothetical protein
MEEVRRQQPVLQEELEKVSQHEEVKKQGAPALPLVWLPVQQASLL